VIDVTGAGDTVISIFAMAMAGGHDLLAAGALANLAGGLVVSRVGAVPVSRRELLAAADQPVRAQEGKVAHRADIAGIARAHQEAGRTVVLTNGCFDLLHAGHVEFLRQASAAGDVLIVAINTDESVRRIKGPSRPIVPARDRAQVLAALADVDHVVEFEEDDPARIVEEVRPDVLVKGSDWAELGVVGRETVEGYGGHVLLVDLLEGYSTTALAARIRQADQAREAP
jgi:D-beta-D-heptose 7-phosphate kinase/D-beta-D-heptose 1-phosphate adenosyltransferase